MTDNTLPDLLLRGLVGAATGGVFAFTFYLIFVAPLKAFGSMRPTVIKINKQISEPEIVQSAIEKNVVSIVVKNRSSLQSIYCTVSILEIPGKDGLALPWQIYSSNIPQNDEHHIELASWFFQKGNRENDNIRILAERSGMFASANQISLPQTGNEICIIVRSPGIRDIKAWCKIWVDQQQKRLMLEKIEAIT